ncbi:hypothetical protein CERSUDRAFT_50006 [Gelatoporia subvermispora B]|uniref:Peptidase C14 caspase domain-containing protein n=1 Tax=Ceriporiopsis subvermispora (strain B) TaxID=914234 RepID=M2PLP4_CERS8|nr:hypothetical protein CERSUDRAFT_50006 [Gelatoporia subvermispora B]
MAANVFALIIGIDKYKAGNIWNLESCVDDAQNIKRWLTHDLHVPRDHICMLLDSVATKANIEDKFMSHLLNNPAIEPGDAIIIYFAGHGSTVRAPPGWFSGRQTDVEVLCPYDHDAKDERGRVAGISDRSLHSMLRDLCVTKGDNITLILDTCFSLPVNGVGERRHARHTPTVKASPDDLLTGLWKSAVAHGKEPPATRGFTGASLGTHIVLAACASGWIATESKGGGNLTHALLTLKDTASMHKLTYSDMPSELRVYMDDHQQPVCTGRNVDRVLFDGVPFSEDAHYVPVRASDQEKLRIDAGAIHGIMEGTEFSVHVHNRRGSLNPPMATYSAVEVHPTWSLARSKSHNQAATREGWARVIRWNNRTPFRVHVRRSLFSFLRRCRLCKNIASQPSNASPKAAVSMMRVKQATQADISVKLRRRQLVVERHDGMIASNCRQIIHLPSSKGSADFKIVDEAAHFHLHLHRKNPQRPLLGLVSMELYRLDSTTWERTSGNLLVNGRAQIVDDDKASIYSVVLNNYSDHDLWPYLAYMDASGYGITMVYHPESAKSAPLRKHSTMVIGSGTPDSEALSFSLVDGADTGAGFLKLFVSTSFTPMTFIEQSPSAPSIPHASTAGRRHAAKEDDFWDSIIACINVIHKQCSADMKAPKVIHKLGSADMKASKG